MLQVSFLLLTIISLLIFYFGEVGTLYTPDFYNEDFICKQCMPLQFIRILLVIGPRPSPGIPKLDL